MRVGGFKWSFFPIVENNLFCFVIAMGDLVHDVEVRHGRCLLLTASGNIFYKCELCPGNNKAKQ